MKILRLICGLALIFIVALTAAPGQSQPNQMPANGSDDISGLYSFLHAGESVQLNLQDGRLTGWVSSFGMLESDKDTLVDRFFKQATLESGQIYFITKPLHGCWLEFTGHVERGEAKDRSQEGYFRLAGTLEQYTTDQDGNVTARQREVVFKSAADEALANAN